MGPGVHGMAQSKAKLGECFECHHYDMHESLRALRQLQRTRRAEELGTGLLPYDRCA